MTQLDITLVEPTGVKHNFDPGATVPGGMPTRCRGDLDHVDGLVAGFFGGSTEPDTQRLVPSRENTGVLTTGL
jgi:hypothetical protein